MIVIVDYGVGNLKSIQNMLKKVGASCAISKDPNKIMEAEKLILPGVGHFDHGMKNLTESGLIQSLNQKVIEQQCPILGICLGAQLLGISSEEGTNEGLGWVKMRVVKFDKDKLPPKLKIPHMGWNFIQKSKDSRLLHGLSDESRFYFVHSYHMLIEEEQNQLTKTNFGYDFTSSVEFNNIYGVQFHPEKSHHFGMQLMKNFVDL